MKRRTLLASCSAGALTLCPIRPMDVHAREASQTEIKQPVEANNLAFIARAYEMRDLAVSYGDQPYGAIVVLDGIIVGESWSRVILDQDPTGHAEISAIRNAAGRLHSRHLTGAALYASSRPCPMCESAAYWAGIDRMFHGRDAVLEGPPALCR